MLKMTCLFLAMSALLASTNSLASEEPIVLGQSAALTGLYADTGQAFRAGALAYFDDVNAKGGVQGRRIELKTLDDGNDPARTVSNTRTLLEKDKVFALFGYVGTATSIAALPLASKAEVPFFAPVSGAQALREPFHGHVYHVRAGYEAEAEKIVEALDSMGAQKIGVLMQNDPYGQAGLDAVKRALTKRGREVMAAATVDRVGTDVHLAVATMKQRQPRAVIIFAAHTVSAQFIRAMRKDAESIPYFWNISYVGSKFLADELGDDAPGVMISEVVPSPWNDKVAVVREYKKLFPVKPGQERGFISLEGFISAKVFVEGLRQAGKELTKTSFTKAMDGMHQYDTGGFVVRFGPHEHSGSHFVDLTVIDSTGQFAY